MASDSSTKPKWSRGAATAEIAPGGALVMVGVGGRLAVVCAGAAIDAGLRHVAVAQIATAAREILAVAPKVVVIPSAMPRAEILSIHEAARVVDAEVVELSAVVAPPEVAHAVAHARARADARRATAANESGARRIGC